MKKINTFTSLGLIVVMLAIWTGPFTRVARATVTYSEDTMTRLGVSSASPQVLSDHAIEFTTSLGVAATGTIVITFPSDFDGSSATGDASGPLDDTDVDLLEDTSPGDYTCDGTSQTLVSGAPGAAEWQAVFSGAVKNVLTLTAGASESIAAGSEVCIKIGENATGGAGNSQYENPTSTGSKVITVVAGTEASQNITVTILTNDQVAVSSTVNQSMTFTIDDNTIGFGTLSPTVARFAGATTGSDGPNSSSAHTMTMTTNAATGYSIKYNGATLTSSGAGNPTITVATITGDENGVFGGEQFAIGFTTNGNATIASAYNQVTPTFNYKFVASTETEIISETVPTAIETFSAFYLANISGATEAGSYTTTITYTASGNF